MSYFPVGNSKRMKLQEVRSVFTTDLSALLKIAQNMPPQPEHGVEREEIGLQNGGNEAPASADAIEPSGDQMPQEQPQEEAQQGDPSKGAQMQVQQAKPSMATQQQGQAQVGGNLQAIQEGFAQVLHQEGFEDALEKAQKAFDPRTNKLRYTIQMKQYLIDAQGGVWDMAPLLRDIEVFAQQHNGATDAPVVSQNRKSPQGLLAKKLPPWTFTVEFGGQQEKQEAAVDFVHKAPTKARLVGRVNPQEYKQNGEGGGDKAGQAKAASVRTEYTLGEMLYDRKDQLVRTLNAIIKGEM